MPISCRMLVRNIAFGLPVVLLVGCGGPPPPTVAASAVGPIPPGQARIWFYRDYEPSVSLNLANVSLNGRYAAAVPFDGSVIYRDVPAGHFHITVESYGRDANQDKDVDLAPGQEAFARIAALSSWESSGDHGTYTRDTFYVYLIPPDRGRAEVATHPLRMGG